MQRFKEHGFVISSIDEFTEHSKALDEVLKKLEELQKKNTVLMKKYRGDAKFARVHKRIREENQQRVDSGKKPLVSTYDETIMSVLMSIKNDIDQKVYDRNDILKKDAYFEQTVMSQIKLVYKCPCKWSSLSLISNILSKFLEKRNLCILCSLCRENCTVQVSYI